MFNYNTFHRKNVNIQLSPISSRNFTYQSLISIIKHHFKSPNGHDDVLDFGCGVGTIDFYLGKLGYGVLGIDISTRAIRLAKKSAKVMGLKNIDFESSSLENFSTTRRFRYGILSEVLEHVDNPELVLRRMTRLLLDNSVIVVSSPLVSAPLYKYGLLNEFDKKVGHKRRFSSNEMIRLMERVGYHPVHCFETEGLLRNLMYTFPQFGFFLKIVRWPFSIVINFIDNLLGITFGYSNIYLVCRRNKQ